jgi:hypothetical protein
VAEKASGEWGSPRLSLPDGFPAERTLRSPWIDCAWMGLYTALRRSAEDTPKWGRCGVGWGEISGEALGEEGGG